MSYIEENLQTKEKLTSVAKIAWWAFIPNALFALIFVLVACIVPGVIHDALTKRIMPGSPSLMAAQISNVDKMVLALTLGLWLWATIFIISLIRKVFYLLLNKLCLTDIRLFGKKGFIKRDTIDAPLAKIDSVSVKATFWGRIFGFSSIVIKTTSEQFVFPFITKTQQFKNEVLVEIEKQKENERIAQAKAMADALKGVNS